MMARLTGGRGVAVRVRPRATPETSPERGVEIHQYSHATILTMWAAAALPMAAAAWVVAPWLADRLDGPAALAQALVMCTTVGLAWQFVLVVELVWFEQRSLYWSVLQEALWLHQPRSPRTGRVGGRVWWVLIPTAPLDTFILSYPTKQYRSAWIGIAVHSAQSVFIVVVVLLLVI